MDIKVGDYVRLARNQGINKIIEEDDDGFLVLDVIIADKYGEECYEISLQDVDKEIVKHSKNLIDLIEVGDIVVILDTTFKSKDFIFINDKEMLKAVKNVTEGRCEILKILTHEQFEANCYEVEQTEIDRKIYTERRKNK